MLVLDEDTAVATLEPEPMAKKKGEDDSPPKTLFSVKGRPAWFAWVKEYADSRGMSVVAVIDFALAEQAKRDGFPKPMPKRMTRLG